MNDCEDQRGAVVVGWVYVGVAGGLTACVVYPLIVFAPLPHVVTVFLAALFGPALVTASVGLFYFLGLSRRSVAAQLGMIFNLLASTLVSAMFFVQLAVRMGPARGQPAPGLVGVWLGLDLAWDVFVSLGAFCFALAALRHPRFGPLLGIPGLLIAVAILVLNLWTFPVPPGEAGLVDIGPALGLWYRAVTLRILGSLGWARAAAVGAE